MITLAFVNAENTVLNVIEFDGVPSSELVDAVFESHPGAVYGVQTLTNIKEINHPKVTKATPHGVCINWTITETDYIPPKPQEDAFWDAGDRTWVLPTT